MKTKQSNIFAQTDRLSRGLDSVVRWAIDLPVIGITLAFLTFAIGCSDTNQHLSREELIADTEYLAEVIQDAHPSPYKRCGGQEAFDSMLSQTISGIPQDGMRRSEFTRHLLPLVAFIGDAHTVIHTNLNVDYGQPGGIPLYFGVVDSQLFVQGVTRKEEQWLIGARLRSVEGVSSAQLVARLKMIRPVENDYGALAWLGRYGDLWIKPSLELLLPEWRDKSKVTVELIMPDNHTEEVAFNLPRHVDYPPIAPPSSVSLPPVERCDFAYTFLDSDKRVALLRISGMMQYREALEMWEADGLQDMRRHGREAYKRFHGKNPPGEYSEVIDGVPSVTEAFRNLAIEMKEAGTGTLLIDLRDNSGGNSYMSNILVYFLFGSEKLLSREPGLEVKKYSQYYMKTNPDIDLESVNKNREVALTVGDYDTISNPTEGVTDQLRARRVAVLKKMSTFAAELEQGTYDGFYTPKNVIVLSTPWTFSSGYTMMRILYRAGAKLAGTPSGQASNCFGDILYFELPNSAISGSVSHKQFKDYPDDPARGKVLQMDYPLTYAKIREYYFDTNAEVLWGMEIAS